jgi:ferredoxin
MTESKVCVFVDAKLCIGAGQCELLEPGVFYLSDDDAMARVRKDTRLSRSNAETVIVQCPSGAIRIED